ncbi:MAG: MinD/ParA family protein [Geothermobacteraceae bacterium]
MNVIQGHFDQAGTLRQRNRKLAAAPPIAQKEAATARVISVTSGKGGVGKTSVAANVAVELSRAGKRVLIIDADLGLANIDVICGLTPRYNLNHYFAGDKSLVDIITPGPAGISILPAGSGLQHLTHLDAGQKMRFLEDLDSLHGRFDIVLIDTEAGISENVTYFNMAAQEILVVTTPEPTAITDAYALMKLMSTRYHQKNFSLVVNQVHEMDDGLDVYQKLTIVSNRYLDISIDYLGCIPASDRMLEAVRRQKPMVELFPGQKTSSAFRTLADSLAHRSAPEPKGTVQFFWKRFFTLSQGGES